MKKTFYRATWISYSTKRRCYGRVVESYGASLTSMPDKDRTESEILKTEAKTLGEAVMSPDLSHWSDRGPLWIWNWTDGGYNSCRAPNREIAAEKAKAMTTGNSLKLNEGSLHEGTNEELETLRASYAGMFD